MNEIEKQKKFFNSISDEYFEARRDRNHLYYKAKLWSCVLKNTRKYFLDRNIIDPDVLEMMCGYAEGEHTVRKYISSKCTYSGFDYSENLIKKVKNQRPEMNVFVQDVTKYIPQKKYDIVMIIGGLHHVPTKADKVLDIINGSLHHKGLFINFEPTNNNMIYRMIRNCIYKKNHIFDEATERAFEFTELNNKYKKAGFRIMEQYHVGLLAYILYYNPDAFPLLNRGNERIVNILQKIDEIFYKSRVGRKISFATFSVLQKP